MKILSIRLKNLASLAGEHYIDFEAEPLASAGLVAIVGKTGAGKSTILDAMCLALFNQIPRLKGSDGKLTDIDGSELLTNSPLTVLRRGTAHGFAEVCFVAQDQKQYLARWEIKRARENVNGKLQNVQRSVTCLSDGVVLADKVKAVETQLQQITQLSFEQFTRAVLLAQSEVTAFLKARDNERGELLEYLTNSSIFTKIGQLAFEKTKEIANQRKQLESVLGHIELLSDDAVAELSEQLQQSNQQHQTLSAEKATFDKQLQWFEQQQKLQSEIVLKQQQHDMQRIAHEKLAADRQRLAQLETFADIRPVVFQLQQIEQHLQQLAPKIQQQHNSFTALSAQFAVQRKQFSQTETALHQLQDFEQQHQHELTQLRKYVQEREYISEDYKKTQSKLTQLDSQKIPLIDQQQQLEQSMQHLSEQHKNCTEQLQHSSQFAPLDQGLKAHVQQLQQFIQQYQKVESSLGNIQRAQTKLAQNQTLQQDLIRQFGTAQQIETQLTQQQQTREQQLTQLNQLDLIAQNLQHYFELKQEIENIHPQLKRFAEQQQTLEQETQKTESEFQSAKTEREKLQQILQQQRLLHAENIEQLRAELQHGEACVVCGSTEHPYRDDASPLSKALFELQQQQTQQAIAQEQQHFQHWQSVQQQLTKTRAEHSQLQQALQQVTEKSAQQHTVLVQQLAACQLQLDLNAAPTYITAQLQQAVAQVTQHKQQLELKLQQLNQASKDQLQLTQNMQVIRHQLDSVQQLQQQVQHIVDCLAPNEKAQWLEQTPDLAQQSLHVLQQRALQLDQLDSLDKQKQKLEQQHHLSKSNLMSLEMQHTELNQQLQEIAEKGKQNTEAAQQLTVNMTGLSELKAHEWLGQHEQQRQQLQSQYQQLKHSFEQARQNFEQQRNQLEQLQAQQQQNQKQLTQCQTTINTWLAQYPEFHTAQLTHLLAITTSQEQHMRATLQQAERLLSEAIAALNTMQEQLQVHHQQQPQIEQPQLLDALQLNQQHLQQVNEQREQYKLKLQVHQQNLNKQAKFADDIQQIQQQEHRWNKISSLIGDAKGKDFRDLAQQYNLDILLEYANQQLAQLSQRYTLKRLDNSLSLAIIDHDMDGETRSVSSLSGGESFLTALAISLAIANMASGSMKIESLFIDEGFGTLDASSLHMVMNALDQLQSQGRKVVLISHIQDMHERIPVQIQVQPQGFGSSRIEVVGS
ncbi:MAG: AAA family ATPase [Acinetobacter sp.]|nr:AAA family ATPase [Acinetobacter sp.]